MKTAELSLNTHNIAHHLTQTLTGVEAVKQLFEGQMGIDKTVVRQLLSAALHRGGDFADIHFEYSTRNSVVMEDGIIKTLQLQWCLELEFEWFRVIKPATHTVKILT